MNLANAKRFVLLPYEITLFSNIWNGSHGSIAVLLPYEITLFSNFMNLANAKRFVLLPYEITLFSNMNSWERLGNLFYYLMKLHYSQTYT